MQKVTDAIYFLVDKTPAAPGCVLVWVDTEECAAETNATIYLSADNRTRTEREPLAQRLSADMAELVLVYNRAPICFASTDANVAAFAAMYYAGLCGIKLASVWSKLVETTTIFTDANGETIHVPVYHIKNASFRIILARFK
jgi:hypothetical protein